MRWLVLTTQCSQPICTVQGVGFICLAHAAKHVFWIFLAIRLIEVLTVGCKMVLWSVLDFAH